MEINNGTRQILQILQEEWKLLLFLTIIFLLYFHCTSTFDFFEKKGVLFKKPTIIVGNSYKVFTRKQSRFDFQVENYNYFKSKGEKMGGVFEGRRPILCICDPDLIKAVTIRDFDHFVDHMMDIKKPSYFARNLLQLKGQEWKNVRTVLTPTFSSARLKGMLPLMEMCSKQMVEYMKKFDKQELEMKDTMGHYTLEIIGACAFGIKCDALSDENTQFIKTANKIFTMSIPKRLLVISVLLFIPSMFKHLGLTFFDSESCVEVLRNLKKAKDERKINGIRKNDFLQLILDAAESEKNAKENDKKLLDDDTIDAQLLLFLLAGYETSSTLLAFAIHVMATKPELQEKLRQHIVEVTSGKELDHDVLSQLTYLDGFFMETLRLYPPVPRLDRACTKQYTIPGTNVELNPRDVISIPVAGIHRDPEIYPDPMEFRPERFMGDEKQNRPSHLFLAFGAGPRNCIGLRFAMYSSKVGMVALLKNFKFSKCDKTEDPITIDTKGVLLSPANGIWVRVEKL